MLQLRKSLNHWVEVDGVELLIDYPTFEQQEELDDIYDEFMSPVLIEAQRIKAEKPDIANEELSIMAIPKMDKKLYKKHQLLTIKYAIKGWKFEEEIKIKDNALEDESLHPLIVDKSQRTLIYDKIQEEISWTENDKKK